MSDGNSEPSGAGAPDEPERAMIHLPFGKGMSIPVAVDAARVVSVHEHEAELVDIRGRIATVIDSYASFGAGKEDGACHERYVRLLDLGRGVEFFHHLAESWSQGISAADPPVSWEADGSFIVIHLTSAPPVRVAVSPGGSARIVASSDE